MIESGAKNRTTQAWLDQVEDMGSIGYWVLNTDTDTVTLSNGAANRLFLAENTICRQGFVEVFAPADRPGVEEALASVTTSSNGSIEVEAHIAPQDEVPVWVRLVACGDRIHGPYGIVQDVTKTKVLDDQLSQLRQRHSDFASMSDEWLWETDADLRFTYVSPRVEDVTGAPAEFHLGKTRRDILGDKNESLEMEVHLAWLERHEPFRDFRYWRAGPDGQQRYMSVSGKPIYASGGTFLGYRGVGRDLTGQQEIREALLQMNRQLNSANKAKSDAVASLKEANALLEERHFEMERVQEEIRHSALHDPLTGLANRRYLDSHLEDLAELCISEGRALSVLHLDLDRFKQINDTLGHAAGDQVLVHVAGILRETTRIGDFVARVGGDEFVVVRASNNREGLGALAQEMIDAFARPLEIDGRECWYGSSVGIAVMQGADIDPQLILTNADVALYRAKRTGRGRFAFFDDSMQREILHQKALTDGIHAGLERAEFVPWYQPQVCAETFEIFGFEALARWHRDDGTIKAPDFFLGVAEDLGVVPDIDRVIMEQALRDLAEWDGLGLSVPKLSVNVSSRRLNEPDLAESMKRFCLPRGRLVFELLESIFLDDLDDAASWNIDLLKEMGVKIALDDFGSGHASIVSLVKLGPDSIKIDRQMTAAITEDEARHSIASSIIGIGKTLNVEVIAEGVETQEQAQMLCDMGCDALQGYFIGKPMPANEVPGFVEQWNAARRPDLTAIG